MSARTTQQRREDALTTLGRSALDGWVATSSPDGVPYLVPLSIVWVAGRVVISVNGDSRTSRNLRTTPRARVGIGPTRDVVMLDVLVDRVVEVGTDEALAQAFGEQADWLPPRAHGYLFFVLRPERIQAWRTAAETVGRTLMRDGEWVVSSSDRNIAARPDV